MSLYIELDSRYQVMQNLNELLNKDLGSNNVKVE